MRKTRVLRNGLLEAGFFSCRCCCRVVSVFFITLSILHGPGKRSRLPPSLHGSLPNAQHFRGYSSCHPVGYPIPHRRSGGWYVPRQDTLSARVGGCGVGAVNLCVTGTRPWACSSQRQGSSVWCRAVIPGNRFQYDGKTWKTILMLAGWSDKWYRRSSRIDHTTPRLRPTGQKRAVLSTHICMTLCQ